MPKDGSPAAIEGMGKAIPPELMAKGKLSQRNLFSFAAFRPAAGCTVTTYDKDRVIVKYVPGRGYLTLNAMQWKALGLFEAQELMVVASVAVVAAQCYRPFHLPGGILELLFGWLLAAVGLSAGDALAACVVRACADFVRPARVAFELQRGGTS